MKSSKILYYIILCLIVLSSFRCDLFDRKAPKNIIVMISDGCGFNHILATDYYQYGETGKQVYQSFPVQYAVSTWSLKRPGYDPEQAWTNPKYLKRKPTDSAAAATAISTGFKTFNKMLCVDQEKRPVCLFSKVCESLGKATGVVTSVLLSHATPAGFIIHHPNRNDYETIAKKMILLSDTDVIMGCGHPFYNGQGEKRVEPDFRYTGGDSLWQKIQNHDVCADADHDGVPDAWHFIDKRSDFQQLAKGDTPGRVLGIPRVSRTLQLERKDNETSNPFEGPVIETVPTLVEMTRGALNVLDNDQDGFFLMVEGGAIDWASHANAEAWMIEEQVFFNNAVEAVVEYIESNSSWDETLLIVTADHETGFLTGTSSDSVKTINTPPVNQGKGRMPKVEWRHKSHTHALVPLYAKGTGAELFHAYADEIDPVRGKYLDNTEIGQVLFSFFHEQPQYQ